MGLMQIMPATWQELRSKQGLGDDPYDPRDNILAGAAYIAELHDLYGSPGFLAAYNAGPGRYEKHLVTGDPLPAETVVYMAKIIPQIDADAAVAYRTADRPTRSEWSAAPLFIARAAVPLATATQLTPAGSPIFRRSHRRPMACSCVGLRRRRHVHEFRGAGWSNERHRSSCGMARRSGGDVRFKAR